MITFCDYMEQALYGPLGYYFAGTAQSGKNGDYFTAPDVGAAFGQLLAEIFLGWKEKLDWPDFSLIEVGAGEGRLVKDILKQHPFRYIAVERSPARRSFLEPIRAEFPNLLEVHSGLEALQGLSGVLFANELIDAFPVHRVRMKNGRLEEAYVGEGQSVRPRSKAKVGQTPWSAPAMKWDSPSTPRLAAYFDRIHIALPENYETEVNLAMADWLKAAAGVLAKGVVVLIDYGRPAHEYYAAERNNGTLRCFGKHGVYDPFDVIPAGRRPAPHTAGGPGRQSCGDPGSIMMDPPSATEASVDARQRSSGWAPEAAGDDVLKDWTSDVDFTSLALDAKAAGFVPLVFMEMGTFLLEGLELLQKRAGERESGRARENASTAHAPTLPRSLALRYLLHPEGLGSAFHVLVVGQGIDPADWVFAHNRLSRLGL